MFKMFPKLNKYNRRHLQLIRNYSSRAKVQSDRNELSSEKIRKTFVDFFVAKNNHKFIRSSPVIPFCDPTVPFVNAGMNQVSCDDCTAFNQSQLILFVSV